MDIDTFKNQIKSSVARPNRYYVEISFPAGNSNDIWANFVKLNIGRNTFTVALLCDQVELPGLHLATAEDKQWGPVRKIPYLPVYNDLSMSFICDSKMLPRYMFDHWQGIVIAKDKKQYYYDDYIAKVKIVTLNEKNEPTYIVTCYEAYPIEVIPQPLSYGEVDTYLKLNVKMAYRFWDMSDSLSSLKDILYGMDGVNRNQFGREEAPIFS